MPVLAPLSSSTSRSTTVHEKLTVSKVAETTRDAVPVLEGECRSAGCAPPSSGTSHFTVREKTAVSKIADPIHSSVGFVTGESPTNRAV